MANYTYNSVSDNIYIPGRGNQGSLINSNTQDVNNKYVGTYHMADRPDLYEPLRTNHFEFQVYGLQAKLREMGDNIFIQTETGNSNSYDAEDVIRLSVDQANIPHFQQAIVDVTRGNSTIHYAGKPTFGDETIRIKDYVGINAKNALLAWQNLSYNVKTEKIGLACNYKFNCILREYTPDYIKVREWLLRGCWIKGLSEQGYDSTAEGLQQIAATISYDRGELWSQGDINI